MRTKLATPAGAFFFLSITAFVYFLLTVIRSIQGDPTAARNFTDGVGIEIIGAVITSLGIIGLEQLYSKPDAEISALQEQIVQQTAKLNEIQVELRAALTTRLQPPEEDNLN